MRLFWFLIFGASLLAVSIYMAQRPYPNCNFILDRRDLRCMAGGE